jgi:hypothetical protein
VDLIPNQSLEWDVLNTIIMTSSGKGSLPHQEPTTHTQCHIWHQIDAIYLPNPKPFDHLCGIGSRCTQRFFGKDVDIEEYEKRSSGRTRKKEEELLPNSWICVTSW